MTHVATTLTELVAAPLQDVFRFVTAEDVLHKILFAYGLLPRVVSTSHNVGSWNVPGAIRTVHLSNNTTARETLTDYQVPSYFAYRTSDFTSVLKYIACEGRGQWQFSSEGRYTRVTWTYTFTAREWFLRPVLTSFVFLLWRGYMRGALQAVKAQTEQQQRTTTAR